MKVTITNYWKKNIGGTEFPRIEEVVFMKVGPGNPNGVVLPGQDPNDRFAHSSSSSVVRIKPSPRPTPYNPLSLPVKPGFVQIDKPQYDALMTAIRQQHPGYYAGDYP